MSEYIKHTWEDGEVIVAPKLNNIETGIAEAKKAAEQNSLAIEQTANDAQTNLAGHNTNTEAHADLRVELKALADRIAAVTTTATNAASAATAAQNTANGKAPAYSYGTEDLTAGTSALETGKLHFVYE